MSIALELDNEEKRVMAEMGTDTHDFIQFAAVRISKDMNVDILSKIQPMLLWMATSVFKSFVVLWKYGEWFLILSPILSSLMPVTIHSK
jgi:hypothetical protein